MPVTQSELESGLRRLVRDDQVLSGAAVRKVYETDAYTVDRHPPLAVVLPETTEEVSAIVQWCRESRVPFTPRGAGTGLSGGAMPALGGVVISTKKLTKVLATDLENRTMLAQTGIANLRITRMVEGDGLHFAPDPSSQSVSTLGGNIAMNSGGPHTLKYGVTVQHVLGVRMVLSHGEIVQIGGPCGEPPGYDLLSLVVGSEGTLGIVTEAWIVLTPIPEAIQTATACFPSVREASQAVAEIVKSGVLPAALEMMDRAVLDAVQAAFGLEFPNATQAMLLIECDGSPGESSDDLNQLVDICRGSGAIEVKVAQNADERMKLWTARKKGVGALGRIAPTVVTHDGVIPPSKLPEMLEEVYRVAEEHGIAVANIFHAGDGNLHPIFCFDEREPGKVDAVVKAGEEIIRKCIELGGSVTGEHGIGVEKVDFLPLMYDAASMALQGEIRTIFASDDLCNPCKVIPNAKGCIEHKVRWRGVAT